MNRNQVAKKVRLEKEAHPERYCIVKCCLWRTRDLFCPRHRSSNVIGEQDDRRNTNLIG